MSSPAGTKFPASLPLGHASLLRPEPPHTQRNPQPGQVSPKPEVEWARGASGREVPPLARLGGRGLGSASLHVLRKRPRQPGSRVDSGAGGRRGRRPASQGCLCPRIMTTAPPPRTTGTTPGAPPGTPPAVHQGAPESRSRCGSARSPAPAPLRFASSSRKCPRARERHFRPWPGA